MTNYKSLVAINASVFLMMIGVGLIVALLPQQIMKLSASVTDVGMLASAFALPYVLFQLPIGRLSDAFGFKALLTGGYLLCGLSGLLYYFADSPDLYFRGRFIQGIAEVPIWTLAPAILSIQYASEKGKFMGIYNASLHCGLTIGGLASIIIFTFLQENQPFLLFAILSTVGGLLTILFVDNPDRTPIEETAAINSEGIRHFLLNGTNLAVFSGVALYGAGYGIFITIVPAFLITTREAGQSAIGIFFAVFYIALSISQFFAGKWSDRSGRKPVMLVGLVIAAGGIAMFHQFSYPLLIMFLTLASLGLGIFGVSSMAFLNDRVSESLKGSISGAFYLFWGLGYFLGPQIMGHIVLQNSYGSGFLLFSILIVLQLLVIGVVVKARPLNTQQNR